MIGIPANQFDELDQPEVIEFRKEAIELCREVIERREQEVEDHVFYAFGAQLLENPSKYSQRFCDDGVLELFVWMPNNSNRPVPVKVAVEANAATVIQEAIDLIFRHQMDSQLVPSSDNYVLKICARQEYLLGNHPISRFKV